MKTITLVEPGQFAMTSTDYPTNIPAGHALVGIKRIGVCGTDQHAYRGKQPFFSYPRILGHELGVEVLNVAPDVTSVAVGDYCSVEPYLNCGTCIACRNGKTNCCTTLRVLGVHTDGGMREQIVVPAHKLHTSAKLTLDQLALIETLGIGAHAVDRAAIVSGEQVLVFGAGPIGLTVIQFAKAAGAIVTVVDINQQRLDFASKYLGADYQLLLSSSTLDTVMEITSSDLPTAVFDATGNPESMMNSFQFVAPGGRLTFVGLFQGDVTFNDPFFHRREMTLLASRNARASDFTRIIGLVEAGKVDTTPWITHRCGFDEVVETFPKWLEPESGTLKAIIHL